eukprot:Nitzschia sp. Nitz4//scaffold3_size479765//232072//233338//NITZ4_000097-RA/size479765-processed-gene-1.289-mRNA-1//-1//CDS//3329550749//69//frame0
MCGRAAQTVHIAQVAAASFGVNVTNNRIVPPPNARSRNDANHTAGGNHAQQTSESSITTGYEVRDNYNMSPGMDATVIWLENGKIQADRKVWGLVTKGGSNNHPLPKDSKERMGLHFGGMIYNARTDTLFSKPSFAKLAGQRRSCLVALDGYFEWKSSPLAGGKGKKQPYFVHRKQTDADSKRPYLLFAGLWTRVPTGLSDEPFLDTFTILTTEACKQIEWLHHRMPVPIWDTALAWKWLRDPSQSTLDQLDKAAKANKGEKLAWHMVTTDMSSVKFRDRKAILPTKGLPSVASFFSKASGKPAPETSPSAVRAVVSGDITNRDTLKKTVTPTPIKPPTLEVNDTSMTVTVKSESPLKRPPPPSPGKPSPSPKKRRIGDVKGTPKITSFFQPKS